MRLASALLNDPFEAEDAVQEAGELAWRRIANVDDARPFRPWFLGIVYNQCRERWRGRWWSVIRLPELRGPRTQWDTEEAWLEGEDLRRALVRLPPDQRVAIVLHFYLGLSHEEAAATLGIKVAGIKARINRSFRQLRRNLDRADVTCRGPAVSATGAVEPIPSSPEPNGPVPHGEPT